MQKYAALRTLATIQRGIATIIALFGAVGLVSSVVVPSNSIFGAGIGTLWMIVALIAAFPLWCYADLIHVFMDIEENTRNAMQEIRATQGQHRENTPADHPTTGNSDCPYCGSKSVVLVPNEIGVEVRKCNDCGRKWR